MNVLLIVAMAMPSDICANIAAVRECIEYGIAQSGSQQHIYYVSRLGW